MVENGILTLGLVLALAIIAIPAWNTGFRKAKTDGDRKTSPFAALFASPFFIFSISALFGIFLDKTFGDDAAIGAIVLGLAIWFFVFALGTFANSFAKKEITPEKS